MRHLGPLNLAERTKRFRMLGQFVLEHEVIRSSSVVYRWPKHITLDGLRSSPWLYKRRERIWAEGILITLT